MCKCIDFTAQLAEKFPWNNLEKEVDGTIFKNVLWEEDSELFWVHLNEVLELHKEEAPLRCAEILDFIGRCGNWRLADEISLAHYKNPDFAGLVLQYLETAVNQQMPLSLLQCLIIRDMAFECANQGNKALYDRCAAVWKKLQGQPAFVKNPSVEKAYLHSYDYLWRNKKQFEAFASAYNML